MKRSKVTKRKGPGRPATGKTPMVGLRLSPGITSKLDAFAEKKGYDTRSEAMRYLLERALACPNITD